LNGSSADFVLRGAVGLLALLVLGVGILAGTGKPVPVEYTSLITALLGLIAGSRVVTTQVSDQIKSDDATARTKAGKGDDKP
jgi:hypothetical protein